MDSGDRLVIRVDVRVVDYICGLVGWLMVFSVGRVQLDGMFVRICEVLFEVDVIVAFVYG